MTSYSTSASSDSSPHAGYTILTFYLLLPKEDYEVFEYKISGECSSRINDADNPALSLTSMSVFQLNTLERVVKLKEQQTDSDWKIVAMHKGEARGTFSAVFSVAER